MPWPSKPSPSEPSTESFSLIMKISRIAKAAVLAATVTLAAPSVFAQNIAIVNGKAVPKARAEAMIEQILKNQQPGQPPQTRTPDLEQKVKDEIVMREIFIQEAERRGLNTSPDYKVQMEFARQSILIRALFQDFEAKNQMTEAEARAEYDKIKAANGAKELRARHILVENEAEAKDLLAKIKGGAKFEELAKKNSKDPGSAENGGDLDWANPSNYVPEFSQALLKLKKGEITRMRTMPWPKCQRQMRLTITRAASGCSGRTSHCASCSRPLCFASKDGGCELARTCGTCRGTIGPSFR